MSNTFKIVYICDHDILETKSELVTRVVTRGTEEASDKITPLRIGMLWHAEYNGSTYLPDVHFQKVGENRVGWICNPSKRPIPGDTYSVIFEESRQVITSYEADTCTRCGGNGWYVDIASHADNAIKEVSGDDKMAQDFIKILLTDNRYYPAGTSFKSIQGRIARDETEMITAVTIAIREAESILKLHQYQLTLANEDAVSDEERLSAVVINEIEVLASRDGFYIDITLINEANLAVQISLQI